MSIDVDLLIVGAGPAGMAAAVTARGRGLSVLVLDENAGPGGQVHRGIERRSPKDDQDEDGAKLAAALRASAVETRFGATLWAVEPGGKVFWSEEGGARSAVAGRLLLCTGATERPLPIPGWTLPGVMTVGAAQIALKTAGLTPQGDVWIAGQGPLLWLYAKQALDAGGRIAGIVDISHGIPPAALRHLPRALMAPGYLLKGYRWQRAVKRTGLRVIQAEDIRAEGEGRLARIVVDGTEHPADLLLLHDGVVPNTQVTRAIPGCAHDWDPVQGCWKPRLDEWGNTTVDGVMVAGDGGCIGGARAAAHAGRLAALEAARALGRMTADQRNAEAGTERLALNRQLAVRPFLDALFPPRPAASIPDETILCRCEEVTAGKVRQAVTLGCLGSNQTKAFTRTGMGPCQGRVCGPAVHAVIAAARGVDPAQVDPFRTRFPTKPLTLGELAALAS
ncbi:NAD(P)/FAD-dependent oxidoreductase [Roseomonas sp. AR75]|uniref:FAD/NAD(P)-dependent oxidoreductase n=1 Tax=Roseomonas sp. AR75 TaxID=2562311 RepID=UPI001F0D232B|nr:NAD(P)/FAD-dependent oxidoreductase [Roseomonas sp. AR75]